MNIIDYDIEERIVQVCNSEHKLTVRELEDLCLEKQHSPVEQFVPNCFYGNSFILKAYACLDQAMSLPLVLPHGVNLSHEPWQIELNSVNDLLLCHSDIQAIDYREISDKKRVIPIGAPYLYASRLVSRYGHYRKRNEGSMIVFPAHSTHHLTAEFQEDQLMALLKEISKNSEVIICLYWRDIQLGRHHRYIREGFDVTTCGHMYEEMFLIRLAVLLQSHTSCLINRLGSCAFYAAVDGLDVSILSQNIEYSAENKDMKSEITGVHNAWHAVAFNETFTYPAQIKRSKQFEVASAALGMNSMRNSKELGQLLLGDISNPMRDKFGESAVASKTTLPQSVMNALNF